jgi:hypothetical protein
VKSGGGVGTANCSGAAPLDLTAEEDTGPPPVTGHHGCDVCQAALLFLAKDEIFGLVPPDAGFSRVIARRSDGESMRLLLPAQTAGPFRAKLPALPAGVRWIEGRLVPAD